VKPDPQVVAEVDSGLVGWRQGDVAVSGAIGWMGDVSRPLTPECSQAAEAITGSQQVAVWAATSDGLVVVTQTCDIVRTSGERPFIAASPLIRLPEPVATEARRGMRPRFVNVPGAGEDAFADLDLVLSMEKSVLAACERIPGCTTDDERRRFARQVGRKFSRVAFPDELAVSLRRMVDRVRQKHEKASVEGRALAALSEIRVTGTPSWSAVAIDVFLTFAARSRADAEAICAEGEWDSLVDGWLALCEPSGPILSVDGAMVPLEELTALEYLDSDQLDLDHLSG
jgi:hypothetical protein